MRDIQFRAWDEEDKKMYHNVGLIGNTIVYEFAQEDDERDFEPIYWGSKDDKCVHIMQHAGFNDKNGKPVYEGDIYKAKMEIVKTGQIIESIEVVEDIRNDNVYHYDEIEVIGNIYENPNLVTV